MPMNVGVCARSILAVAATALALLGAPGAAAQATGSVAGTVSDSSTRQPVPGVQVTIVGTSRGSVTDEAGRYVIRSVPSGSVEVRAQRLGYGAGTRSVTVAPN